MLERRMTGIIIATTIRSVNFAHSNRQWPWDIVIKLIDSTPRSLFVWWLSIRALSARTKTEVNQYPRYINHVHSFSAYKAAPDKVRRQKSVTPSSSDCV